MFTRVAKVVVLSGAVIFCTIGVVHAQSSLGPSTGVIKPRATAPELDPSMLGAGLVMLVGGLLLLGERRRVREQ
ncbi:MAG TPA: hypothetical protein VMU41_13635 [Candidatus Binataceae bacterium]|nr:hypothetical protein [Candidatus Binataceae bacterium]